jgi:hypothetical protein
MGSGIEWHLNFRKSFYGRVIRASIAQVPEMDQERKSCCRAMHFTDRLPKMRRMIDAYLLLHSRILFIPSLNTSLSRISGQFPVFDQWG